MEFDARGGFRRLVSRSPELGNDARVQSIILKDHGEIDNAVLTLLCELFLRPSTTLLVGSCFRPLLSEIILRTLQSMKQLRESSQWHLSTHEQVCVAFSKVLEIAPFLLSSILQYFAFAPSPFQRLFHDGSDGLNSLLDLLRATYNFLRLEPKVFRDLWDYRPLLNLVKPRTFSVDVRWSAIQIFSVVFQMSDAATRGVYTSSGIFEAEAFSCLIRWEECSKEITVEKAGAYIDYSDELELGDILTNEDVSYQSAVRWKRQMDAKISHVLICGVELPVRGRGGASHQPFVITNSVRSYLEAVALGVSQRQPVLVEGPVGSGKTSLIREVARLTGNDILFIHLDDQMDTKTLLGNYVCTEIPGEFRWQPGTLTQALANGLWIVFEDIDKAPSEIFSALVPLLEDRKLQIPGRGETMHAADEFRIFATVSRGKGGSTWNSGEGRGSFFYLWRRLEIQAPSDEELASIVRDLFPGLTAMTQKILGTLNLVKDITSRNHLGRQSSMRDLLKFCKRIAPFFGEASNDHFLLDSVRGRIYWEAVDCFAGSVSSPTDSQLLMRAIAEQWVVPFKDITYFPIGFITSKEHKPQGGGVFSETGHTMRLMSRIERCVELREPVLLVGETGTGKTTLVQRLAWRMSVPLTVVNMSQQSDAADFMGGFKPVEAQSFCLSLLETFSALFKATFSLQENEEYWATLNRFVEKKKWKQLLKAFRIAVSRTAKLVSSSRGGDAGRGSKRQKSISEALLDRWRAFSIDLGKAEKQVEASENAFAFAFVEGAVVKALKTGSWLLLDEINLAPAEILVRLNGVFDGESGSICLTERGDLGNIERHPNFRIFACMNPATDVGKHDLPLVLRNKFTEFFVHEMDSREDLEMLVKSYLEALVPINRDNKFIGSEVGPADIVDFYKEARREADERLLDSGGQKPQYSLRSLSRGLEFTAIALRTYGLRRALFDGVCMFFLTLLDQASSQIMERLIVEVLFKKATDFRSFSRNLLNLPARPNSEHVLIEKFEDEEEFVITESISEHLRNLARAIFIRRYPVLLQGPTSSGKTSLVEYLARKTGHKFVRINNHEHTDLQEYLGCYVADEKGKLTFKEGLLVEAVRNGYWVVLDELNLAPSEVLEALNRLLDDNRELFVPELQTTIKPHPQFMLFATQNPPGIYGGRKVLSRAFRNRFIELHVDDIPASELCKILERRCKLPRRHAEMMVGVMKELQLHRQGSKVFAGKHGFITPRDLFRWGKRQFESGVSYDDLARLGYFLLGERVRNDKEKAVVQSALESNMRVKLEPEMFPELLLSRNQRTMLEKDLCVRKLLESAKAAQGLVWTKSLKRLFYLAAECYAHNEPLLLVGETGCGKTTVCQLLAQAAGKKLHIINCHQHTETSDFLGGFRPIRRESIASEYYNEVIELKELQSFKDEMISTSIEESKSTLSTVNSVLRAGSEDRESILRIEKKLRHLETQWQALFTWQDGPLVHAMREGDLILVDEISLAEDSVLERLNSILEPKRSLVLAENGGSDEKEIIAKPGFRLIATMNPGGDFGKKELSPALRNRFTEVWVPPIHDLEDLKSIVSERLTNPEFTDLVQPLLHFWQWFQQHQELAKCLSVRDLLSWTDYIENAASGIGKYAALVHGAFLVLLDGLGLGSGISSKEANSLKISCVNYLLSLVPEEGKEEASRACALDGAPETSSFHVSAKAIKRFGNHPFYISQGNQAVEAPHFEFAAPTTGRNVMRLLRAMQLPKPVLLEGSPGVGKTSLVSALAAASGNALVRINLSEQTDILDLFGSDLPVEGGNAGEFQWSDGIFLQALKSGSWVLLDELNLASQSVLEGLNSCLDHRREVFIPELGQVYKCPSSFRIFACQNPLHEGGGRKGLPKSFMNRFSKVFVEPLSSEDYVFISRALHSTVSEDLLAKMVQFNTELHYEITVKHAFGHSGSPWELNLRDILRWCSLIEGTQASFTSQVAKLAHFVYLIYLQRLRTQPDRAAAASIFTRIFGIPAPDLSHPQVTISGNSLQVGLARLGRRTYDRSQRDSFKQLQLLPGMGTVLESVMHCVKSGWMIMLVGPPKSGKTSVIRSLASLTGNTLCEYSLSRATDTSELLGCYEQHDMFRCWREAIAAVNYSARTVCSFLLSEVFIDFPVEQRLEFVTNIVSRWSRFKQAQKDVVESSALPVNLLSELIDELETSTSSASTSLDFGLKRVRKLQITLQNVPTKKAGRFEWVDGDLLRAVERGDWVLLENANLCNPTVLDRLNPLLEPGGKIVINERGLINGQAMMVQAHPNFRLFLTLDPSNGELSRAMRNRGVEVFLMGIDREKNPSVPEVYRDVGTLLRSSGIPGLPLIKAMCKVHTELNFLGKNHYGSTPSLRELSQWITLFHLLLERGESLHRGISYSWEQSYLPCFSGNQLQEDARRVFYDCFRGLRLKSDISFHVPGGWPSPLVLQEYIGRSRESVARRDCGYIAYLAGKLLTFEVLNQSYAITKSDPGTTTLLNWLQNSKSLAVHFPQKLLHFLHYPQVKVELSVDGEVDAAKIEKMMVHAVFWMLEQAPGFDIEVRKQWLEVVLSALSSKYPKVEAILGMLKLEEQHPVVGELRRSWNNLLGMTNSEAKDELMQTCISRTLASESFYNAGGNLESAWRRFATQFSKLSALRITLFQWKAEDNYLMKPLPAAARVTETCLKMLLPMLRKLENEVLTSNNIEWDGCLGKSYLEVIDWHISLWRSTQAGNDDVEFLHFIWSKLKIGTECLAKVAKLEILFEELRQLTRAVDTVLSAGKFSFMKPFLWKHGGHPRLPGSIEILNSHEKLLAAARTIWPSIQTSTSETAVLASDPSVWRLVLEGLSMASCTTRESSNDSQVPQEVLKVVTEMLNVERRRFQGAGAYEPIPVSGTVKECRESYPKSLCGLGCAMVQRFPQELLRWTSGQDLWFKTRPWINHLISLLNVALLAELSVLIAAFTYHEDQLKLMEDLRKKKQEFQHVLSLSMRAASRSPTAFAAHQQIIWVLEADLSTGGASCLRDMIHDMTFHWHSALWEKAPSFQDFPASRLFQAVETSFVIGLIDMPLQAKDYHARKEQLQTSLVQAWFSGRQKVGTVLRSELRRASAILQQVVYAHKKLFANIDSVYRAFTFLHSRLNEDTSLASTKIVEELCSWVEHSEIAETARHAIISCLNSLYLTSWDRLLYGEALSSLGKVWLLLGKARVELLLLGYGVDPMAKYIYRRRELLHKRDDLHLQIEVHEASCALVTGGVAAGSASLESRREHLNKELGVLEAKVVPRPNPPQFRSFVQMVYEFIQSLGSTRRLDMVVTALTKGVPDEESQKAVEELAMWQDNANAFIEQLSSRYKLYMDLVQPVQLGIYELKYGLSLVTGGFFSSKAFPDPSDLDATIKSVCALMEFPSSRQLILSEVEQPLVWHPAAQLATPKMEKVLEKISCMKSDEDSKVAELKMKVLVLRAALASFTNSLVHSKISTEVDLKILNGILNSFVNIWKQIRAIRKASEEENTQQIRFTSHELETEAEQEEASFKELFPSYWSLEASDGASMDYQFETLQTSDQVSKNVTSGRLLAFEDDMLTDVVDIYKRLFGGRDRDMETVSDKDWLKAFLLGYETGATLIEAAHCWLPKDQVDDYIFPAHLLRLAVEHIKLSTLVTDGFDIYKDSNPSELSRMLDPLAALLKRIGSLLEEWPEHPILLQVAQFANSLISIPLHSPIMKALTGLELVLSKAQVWEQNAPKLLALEDELTSISQLVLRWRKLELQTWPTLLQGVTQRHIRNSEKLWFPFYDLLHKGENLEIDTLIESVEELLLSAPLGEFGSRLKLIMGFFREFFTYSKRRTSAINTTLASVLFNIYQYYLRFLPSIEESLTTGRTPIEKELSDFVRLSKWEDYNYYSLASSAEKSHRKLHKLVRKYDEHLKRPSMEILKKKNLELQPLTNDVETLAISTAPETLQSNIEAQWTTFCGVIGKSLQTSPERKITSTGRILSELLSSHVFSKHVSEIRQEGAETLEHFATSVITRSAELKDEGKSLALKKKALVDLKRGLKELGLSHRKSDIPQDMRSTKSWFREAVFNIDESVLSSQSTSVKELSEIEQLLLKSCMGKWKRAEGYYFDNIYLLQKLYASSLNYNKDLTLSEVERFTRYMEHLLFLQQKCRRGIYDFALSFTAISNLNAQLKMLGSALPVQQTSLRKVMWKQKDLLDRLSQLAAEVELFLRTVEQADTRPLRAEASTMLTNLSYHFKKLQSCKDRLDKLLATRAFSNDLRAYHPLIVTDEMLAVVLQNASEVREVEAYVGQVIHDNDLSDSVISRILKPVHSLLQEDIELPRTSGRDTQISHEVITETVITEIRLAGQGLAAASALQNPDFVRKTLDDFAALLGETLKALRLDNICKYMMQTISQMSDCLDQAREDASREDCVQVLKSLSVLLNMLEAAGFQVLSDYVSLYKAAAKLGYVVSNVLNHLYRDGFCKPREESESDKTKFEDAEGTGMGEGEGTKDVSEQIEDENQLLSGSENPAASKSEREQADKGIEMEQDFDGDMFDVSEDESDEEDADQEGQDEKLDSKMGEQDENAEVVDEKLWDREDEKDMEDGPEKYEQGAAVPDTGADELELRGKELDDRDEAKKSEDELLPEDKPKPQQPHDNQDPDEHGNEGDESVLDMDDAFEQPSGTKPSSEEIQMEEVPTEDKPMDELQENDEMETQDGLPENLDVQEDMDEDGTGADNRAEDGDQDAEQEAPAAEPGERKDATEEPVSKDNQTSHGEMETDGQEAGSDLPEANDYNSGIQSESYGIRTQQSEGDPLPNAETLQTEAQADAGPSSRDNMASSSTSLPSSEQASNVDKLDPNPFRSVGDALKKWKEMARMVEDDQQANASADPNLPDEVEDHDAYKYVSTGEQSTGQTLGAATDEQMKESEGLHKLLEESEDVTVSEEPRSLESPSPMKEPGMAELELRDGKQVQKQQQQQSTAVEPVSSDTTMMDVDEDARAEAQGDGSMICLRSDDFVAEETRDEPEVQKIRDELKAQLATCARDMDSARNIWNKYEKLTGRLSQELAEQLRLILEPTLAARFQGDYKSGKRLNLKKIIPFVASGFKSDKIWLRRTKANKRQYQVVLALDDSRSMSESHCGHMALEALITLCRAMTQLEVGEMAVASFGRKGNVRLLHNFDQPFSSEAGVRMISEFSFMQDNTISDEPMVDLLQNLTATLESKSAGGASRGDLQQLVLIIADGRFHEKESLRRCVRDALSRRQLLAFLVLDNPRDSLVNMKTVTFPKGGGGPSFSNYLDSFPFPYYILLKDVEELPRTLADLLRQWFELTQHT